MANVQRYGSTSSHLLDHILERPDLVAAVRELPGSALSRLIERVGLEDSGELIALASTPQLQALFDEDLWRSDAVGDEEHFDPQRFGLWLSLMAEAGNEFLLQRLVELPLDLLTLAVHRAVLVLDMDALSSALAGARDEAGEIERALDNATSEEWEEFRLIAHDPDVWELVWDALLLLDRDQHHRLRAILEHCCAMSTEYINGRGSLYEVLTSDEMLESDARSDRDDRRAASGFVSASDARAFLALAGSEEQGPERDAITAAYFRALHLEAPRKRAASTPLQLTAAAGSPDVQALMQLIAAAEEQPQAEPPKALPRGKAGTPARADEKLALARALASLSTSDPEAHTARMEELGYLANVLIAGCPHEGRKLRPVEALEAAVAITSLGLELSHRARVDDAQRLRELGCDRLFRKAWHTLQRDVVQPARRSLNQGADEPALRALAETLPWLVHARSAPWIDSRAKLQRARKRVSS